MEREISISLEQLIGSGCLFFEQLNVGLREYPYDILEGTEEELFCKIELLVHINGFENSYVDFYYNRLSKEERLMLFSLLNEDQISYIKGIAENSDTEYYQLTKELLEITAILNAKEMLFSTYYFSKFPSMIWGNYERKYPIFYKDLKVREIIEGVTACKKKNMDYLHRLQ